MRRTPLYRQHVELGARMVPFAGWEMPVQYEGVIPEHLAVRHDCGAFDVSHMGEIEIEGPRAREVLDVALSNDLGRIGPWHAQYTLLTNVRGGIIDDLIVYEIEPTRFLLVVNASNAAADFEWLKEREIRGSDVRDVSDEYALIAVQGPSALERLELEDAPSFTFAEGELGGVPCMVNRTGYTGEHGVELLVMAGDASQLWEHVVASGAKPCGLGARDTLRLEVCYPLHGNDISSETDAISAGLGWVCALDREFTGATELRRIEEEGSERKLVAFVMTDKAIPRQGMSIAEGGVVTSGTHSPMLDQGIGMGYVPSDLARPDQTITIDVRGRPREAKIVEETHLQARGALTWRRPRATQTTSGITPSTTGPASTETRLRSALPGMHRTRSASSCTTSRRTWAQP